MTRKRLSAREREQCWDDASGICHLCELSILKGEAWEVSHIHPLAAGGPDTRENRAPAHKKCHAKRTADIDAPLIAKTRRQRQKDLGIRKQSTMPGSKASPWRRRMNGKVERRTP